MFGRNLLNRSGIYCMGFTLSTTSKQFIGPFGMQRLHEVKRTVAHVYRSMFFIPESDHDFDPFIIIYHPRVNEYILIPHSALLFTAFSVCIARFDVTALLNGGRE